MTQLVKGSLQDVARSNQTSLAEAFMGAKAIVLVDCSASMDLRDCTEKRRRFEVACQQLIQLQRENAGAVAVIAWDDRVQFCPGGVPFEPRGSTDLAKALRFVFPADGTGVRLIVISDGEPDSQSEALAAAAQFTSQIDCIYCGPETGAGRDFLRRLAEASGGVYTNQTVKDLPQLAATVQQLLVA